MKYIPVDIDRLKLLVNQGLSLKAIAEQLNITYSVVRKRMASHGLKGKYHHKYSTEDKARMSEWKRNWNRDNPEKLREYMITRSKNKNHSVPCERLKTWLRDQDIVFIEEYQPMREKGRFFSIDVAFPDKKIGIEVNGNQHYERSGALKPKYQERHDLIEKEGWTLYELHYPVCFKDNELKIVLNLILGSSVRVTFDYGTYRAPKNTKYVRKHPVGDNSWRKQARPQSRKPRPSIEWLCKAVWEKPVVQLAKDLHISGNGLAKWCIEYDIPTPPRGYWQRRRSGMTHEEAMSPKEPSKVAHRVTNEVVNEIVRLKGLGYKWTKIGKIVGFDRHTVHRAYLKQMARPEEVPSP